MVFLIRQMNLPYLSWASHSAMTNADGVPVILPHHQAAPALPLDQSCLPEESASATRAHSSNGRSSTSHHGSPTFSNTMPEFMDIDSVSAAFTTTPPRWIGHPVLESRVERVRASAPGQMWVIPAFLGCLLVDEVATGDPRDGSRRAPIPSIHTCSQTGPHG